MMADKQTLRNLVITDVWSRQKGNSLLIKCRRRDVTWAYKLMQWEEGGRRQSEGEKGTKGKRRREKEEEAERGRDEEVGGGGGERTFP